MKFFLNICILYKFFLSFPNNFNSKLLKFSSPSSGLCLLEKISRYSKTIPPNFSWLPSSLNSCINCCNGVMEEIIFLLKIFIFLIFTTDFQSSGLSSVPIFIIFLAETGVFQQEENFKVISSRFRNIYPDGFPVIFRLSSMF